jgi:hypothetical protein
MSRQKLFENQYCPNNYLVVELKGTQSNHNAVGTRLEIIRGGMHTYDSIITGDGGCNFHSYPLETGLGENTLVDEIRIFWPNSNPQYLYNVQANQYLHITEGDPVGVEENPHGIKAEVIPNPTRNMFSLNLKPGMALNSAEIINASGKVVLHQEEFNDELLFNVTGLPMGLYFIRLHTSEGVVVRKLIIE